MNFKVRSWELFLFFKCFYWLFKILKVFDEKKGWKPTVTLIYLSISSFAACIQVKNFFVVTLSFLYISQVSYLERFLHFSIFF